MPAPRKDTTPPPHPLSLALGRRVIDLRGRDGLTLDQLAKRAGMDRNYLWRIEEGRQNLSFRNVARLAKALGVTLSELVDGIDLSGITLESRAYGRGAGGEGSDEG